jgi:hypothetical protein
MSTGKRAPHCEALFLIKLDEATENTEEREKTLLKLCALYGQFQITTANKR